MRDFVLEAAGSLAIIVAVAHAILGETKLFAKSTIEPPSAKLLIRLVWHCSAVAWAGGGVLLMAVPLLKSDIARLWIILVLSVVYAFGAVSNAWATRGRHIGWKLLTGIVILALVGL